ncbi:hypothetical protein LINGRAHAP2_LOCUS31819 [Linum grandiflorum]
MENLLELSGVEPYIFNSAQVVFLNERPTKSWRNGRRHNVCEVCGRRLLGDCRFCPLGCKVT